MARREFKGAAVPTRLTAGIGAADTSFNINSNAGWPTGGGNGSFTVILDPDVPGKEEVVLVGSQSGGACTSVTRGFGDTTAVAHGVGADGSVIHGTCRLDPDEANRHINVTTDDDHTQYMKTDGTRHDLTARHAYGGALGTRPIPVAIGTALDAGVGAQAAAGDHVHTIGAGAINSNTMFTNGVIGSGRLAVGAISASNMFAAGIVDAAAVAVGAINNANKFTAGVVDSTALGAAAVVAGKVAAGGISATNQITDAIVTLAKFASEAATDWSATLVLTNVVLGTGGSKWAHYLKLGRLVVLFGGFRLGTGGDVTGELSFTLPFTAAKLTPSGVGHRGGIAAARTVGGDSNSSGLGSIDDADGKVKSIITAGGSLGWGNIGDGVLAGAGANTVLDFVVVYVATS